MPPGACAGRCKDARNESLHPSLHPPPTSTTASAFPKPCCPLGEALWTCCHTAGSCCCRDPAGEAARKAISESVVHNPRETPQPFNISRLKHAKK